MITYRILNDDEFHRLDRFYAGAAVPRPDPQWSRVFVAELDGEIIGLIVMQMVLHAEPIWIDPAHRGAGVWRELAALLCAHAQHHGIVGVYTQPTTDKTKHMCEEAGWVEMEWPLYLRVFDPRFGGMIPAGPIDLDEVTPPDPGEYLRERNFDRDKYRH